MRSKAQLELLGGLPGGEMAESDPLRAGAPSCRLAALILPAFSWGGVSSR